MAKFSIKKLDLKTTAVRAAGVSGGAYAAIKANKIEAIKSMEPWKRGLIKIAAGALISAVAPQVVKDKTMQTGLAGLGDGIVAIGAIEAGSKFDTSLPVLAGNDVMGAINFDESYNSPLSGTSDVLGTTGDIVFKAV
jgi:hypothetical protein